MTYNIKIFSILLVCLSTFHFVPNRAEQFSLQSSGNERAIKYKPKSAAGPTTRRPTWRPIKLQVGKEATDATFPDPDLDPDSKFPDDYYDNYDGELEGTRRNIFLHNTFEERMKTYNKLMQSQNNNNKATQDILQKTLKVAKEEQKKRNAARKKTSRSRKVSNRAAGQNQAKQQQQVEKMLTTLLT